MPRTMEQVHEDTERVHEQQRIKAEAQRRALEERRRQKEEEAKNAIATATPEPSASPVASPTPGKSATKVAVEKPKADAAEGEQEFVDIQLPDTAFGKGGIKRHVPKKDAPKYKGTIIQSGT